MDPEALHRQVRDGDCDAALELSRYYDRHDDVEGYRRLLLEVRKGKVQVPARAALRLSYNIPWLRRNSFRVQDLLSEELLHPITRSLHVDIEASWKSSLRGNLPLWEKPWPSSYAEACWGASEPRLDPYKEQEQRVYAQTYVASRAHRYPLMFDHEAYRRLILSVP